MNSILTVGDGCECRFILVLGYGTFMRICLVKANNKQSAFVVISVGQGRRPRRLCPATQGLEEIKIGSL